MTRLAKIGLFVLITGVGSAFYIMQTAETINASSTYKVKAYIEDASGLNPGTRVWVAGVTVGRVRDVRLSDGRAQLHMEISSDVPVYRNAVLRKKSQSMLGNAVVSLEPGTPEAAPVEEGETIPQVVSSTEMDRAFDSVEKVAGEMERFMTDLNSFMSDEGGYSTLEDILNSTQDTIRTTNTLVEHNLTILSESLENISKLTSRLESGGEEEMGELRAILENTSRITERIDRLLASQTNNIDEMSGTLKESLNSLNKSLSDVRSVTAKIERGEGSIGKLIHEDNIYNRVDKITEDVEGLVGSAMGMDVRLGFKTEYMTKQQETKTHAGVRLVPEGKDKYYSIGVVDSPSGLVSETETRTQVDDESDGSIDSDTTTYEEKTNHELKLDAQIARNIGPVTLRGGLIENSAGFGIGYQPIDLLRFSTELFAFNQEKAPYFRGYGTIYPLYDPQSDNPLKWLYITGGVDNAFVGDKRDYFVGFGLRFTDNDLRAVMPFMPAP